MDDSEMKVHSEREAVKMGRVKEGIALESTPLKFLNSGSVLADDLNWADALKQITGTKDSEIAGSIFKTGADSIVDILTGDSDLQKASEASNVMLQSLHDFQPKDAIEARLVSQSAALYQHAMNWLSMAGRSNDLRTSEAQTNMAIKLFKCYNETIEALNRYRRGGEQRVLVQHVNIDNSGGGKAAIVGAIVTDQKNR